MEKPEKKKSYLSKQAIAAIIIATVIAVALPLYFFVLRPMFAGNEPEDDGVILYEPLYGEDLHVGMLSRYKQGGGTIYMYKREATAGDQVLIHSKENGDWSFRFSGSSALIDGYECILPGYALVDLYDTLNSPQVKHIAPSAEELMEIREKKAEKLSAQELESAGGINMIRLSPEDCAEIEINYAEYGLGDLEKADRITVRNGGKEEVLYLGDYTLDGRERYACRKEVNAVYKLTEAVTGALSYGVYDVMDKTVFDVTEGAATGDYTFDKFILMRDGKIYVNIELFSAEEALARDRMTKNLLIKQYQDEDGETFTNLYDTSTEYAVMLYENFMKNLYGEKIVAAENSERQEDEQGVYFVHGGFPDGTFEKFHIDPVKAYRALNTVKFTSADKTQKLENLLVFSSPQTDENGAKFYYVYNLYRGVIAKVSAGLFPFLDEDEDYFVGKYMSLFYFNNLDTFSINATDLPDFMTGDGAERIKESFRVVYQTENGERTVSKSGSYTLEKILLSDGSEAPDASDGEKATENFRHFFYHFNKVNMYTNLSDHIEKINQTDLSKPQLTITFSVYGTERKHQLNYFFYDDAGLWAFFTLDGVGRYIVRTEDLKNIVRGAAIVRDGGSIIEALGEPGS